MKPNFWLIVWLALGAYSVVATIGGSPYCAGVTLLCGFMAGRAVKGEPDRNSRAHSQGGNDV